MFYPSEIKVLNHGSSSGESGDLPPCVTRSSWSPVIWTDLCAAELVQHYSFFICAYLSPPITAGKSGFGSFLSLGHSPEKADRIYMKGPGGRGEVEVAVSGVLDQSKQVSGPSSPTSKSGFATIVRRAANAASVAAKHAYAAAAATRGPDEEMMPLKCCLMSVSLPWEHIASDLLFKGSPPVNL
ncbi:hypothetical protein TEA_025630 [Camellia sinensis var. sinensis]|uniref:Uncharacterized protein n=1 Tax=Camellia sinensis var. sinensis TaxID=542762 RepID=A0A4S4DY43_CAMSN|nr:hypothetical protein TEA_025630 [Camellia sinensis var. sinensis]